MAEQTSWRKPGRVSPGGLGAAAEGVGAFQDQDPPAGLGELERGDEPVGTAAHDHRAELVGHRPTLAATRTPAPPSTPPDRSGCEIQANAWISHYKGVDRAGCPT